MLGHCAKLAQKAYRWLVRRPSYMLLTADTARLDSEPAHRFVRAWGGLILLAVVSGVALVGVWGLAWRMTTGVGIAPVIAALTLVLWPFRRGIGAMAELLAPDDPAARAVVASALVAFWPFCFLAIKTYFYHGELVLPAAIAWIRPDAECYRVLLIMPCWGAWSMLVACQFPRHAERIEPPVAALAGGCGPMATAVSLAIPLTVTLFYFGFLGWWGVTIPLATALAGTIGPVVLCRIAGGLRRRPLLATNVLTQGVFLLAYLANR